MPPLIATCTGGQIANPQSLPQLTVNGQTKSLKRKNEKPPSTENKVQKLSHDAEDSRVPSPQKQSFQLPKKRRGRKPKTVLNRVPQKLLNVYVFGDNGQGELGLGGDVARKAIKRPRLNPMLPRDSIGVVQIAAGGMHCAVLTYDNKILTWGVNDLNALGRDTSWDGDWVDIDGKKSDAGSDSSSNPPNPKESTPTAVDSSFFPLGTKFVQLAAGDSTTFALTSEGNVYGWGTFRGSDGIVGFTPDTIVQKTPVLIAGLRNITKLAAGSNHALALTSKGAVLSWGFGDQCQLGRRLIERKQLNGLLPQPFGLQKDFVDIGAGASHSFAIHKDGSVYGWGLNNFGQAGVDVQGLGTEDFLNVVHPTPVKSLRSHGKAISVSGGNHHSIVVTDQGACLTWGRLDAFALGLDVQTLPQEDLVRDDRGQPRILKKATRIPGLDAVIADAGIDHSLAVSRDGKAYGWGFSSTYQTGQGIDDDIQCASLIDNTAIRGKRMTWVGAGGYFSILAEEEG